MAGFTNSPNRAPRYLTILVAVIVAAVAALCTWGPGPDRAGAWLFVVSTVVMLLGVFVPGL
jgi:uncharacterized membrane protein YhaH (DUF805 family)